LVATASPAGGTYSWSTGGTGSSITVSPTATTPYTVTYTANGCTSTASTSTVTVNPLPTVDAGSDTLVCEGNLPIVLTANSITPGVSFLWNTNETTAQISVNASGTYSVEATLNGCSSYDTVVVQVDPCSGISENKWNIEMYPNPTSDFLHIISENDMDANFALYSADGKLLFSDIIKGSSKSIDLSSYASGTYLVRFVQDSKVLIYRVVKNSK
jgi:hypothetical protein